MARIRSVKPELCTSETMAAVSAVAERTFVRLWTHCDDEGRCKDNPKLLKAALFPLHDDVTAAHLDAHLWELSGHGLIVRYSVDGDPFLHVPSWHDHQKPQKKQVSKLPAPDQADDVAVQHQSRTATRLLPETYGPVVEGRVEVEGVVAGDVEVEAAAHIGPQLPVVEPASPPVDVEQQVRKAVGIYSRTIAARHPEADDPGAYAYGVGQKLTDEDRASLAEWITDGDTAEDAAARLADPLRDLNPLTRPSTDPAAIAAADELAKRREQATADRLAEQRAVMPAAPPPNLKAALRPPATAVEEQEVAE